MQDILGREIKKGSFVVVACIAKNFAFMKYGRVTQVDGSIFRMVLVDPKTNKDVGGEGDWFTLLSHGFSRVAIIK